MKIILCGYNWTGCDALRQLLNANHEVFAYTHESPYHIPSVSEYCKKLGVDYSFGDISKSTLPFKPDCIVSIYYRFIIKSHVIDACNGQIMNLHPSLLPRYRGCSSLTWAMIDQQPETGFSYHYVDAGCDTGKIILQERIEIMPFDNQGTLYHRVGVKAMECFMAALDHVLSGKPGIEQMGEATYFPRGCPHDGRIDCTWPESKIDAFIRAMVHPPYPAATFKGKEILSFDGFKQALLD